ncbi:MAG: phosphodiester glycosidase family protein [Anaerolineae bacterium]
MRTDRRAADPTYVYAALLLLGLALACAFAPALPTPTPRPTPGPSATPTLCPSPTPLPTRTPLPPDTGWQPTHPGIEVRSVNVQAGELTERLTIARLDPAQVRLRVFYAPGAPAPVGAWARQTDALLVVNGGYFTAEQEVTGLTITNGEVHGTPLGDYAGMLAVGYDESVSVRWLRTWPYDPTEGLREAVQSFPVLVKPGGVMGFPADADDGRASRRTVVAQDVEGRVLLTIAPRGYLSLHELAIWLAGSDLGVDVAVNLDGGTSSGFWLQDAAVGGAQVESLIPVPVVIAVLPR